MAESNPFANLLTPEILDLQRQNEAMTRFGSATGYAPTDFWVREAALGGVALRKARAENGQGMNDEDIRAARSDLILRGAAEKSALAVSAGDITPDEAQGMALEIAMQDFARIGDYESVNAIAPALQTYKKSVAERAKLGAEAENQRAQGYRAVKMGDRFSAMAQETMAMLPYEQLKALAEAGNKNADAELKRQQALSEPANRALKSAQAGEAAAHGRYWDRMPASDTDDPTAKDLGFNNSDLAKGRELVADTRNFLDINKQLLDMYARYPGIGSKTAKGVADAKQWVSGMTTFFARNGQTRALDTIETAEGVDVQAWQKRIEKAANRMAVSPVEFSALVASLAYQRAKIEDRGGRVTDKDFEVALEMSGATQDPATARAIISRNMKNAQKKAMNFFTVDPAWLKTSMGPAIRGIRDQLPGSGTAADPYLVLEPSEVAAFRAKFPKGKIVYFLKPDGTTVPSTGTKE